MKNKLLYINLALHLCVSTLLADYVITQPQPLARSLTEEQLEVVISKAPTNANVTLPAHLLASKKNDIETNAMLNQFQLILADTRKNIPECKNMGDIEIAMLYIQQMQKNITDINATTNSIEYIIGAGMRDDIQAASAAEQEK